MSTSNSDPFPIDVSVYWETTGHQQLIDEDNAASLLSCALGREAPSDSWEIAIRFVGDEEMCRLHERFMGDPNPTDILTFPYDADDGVSGGDIVISVDTAVHNASDAGWSIRDELQFLMLHGLLHILGWDDQDDADRTAMLAQQHALLAGWLASGPT